MKTLIQEAYERLPPEIQAAMDHLILSVSQQHKNDDAPPFNGLKGFGSMPGIWMSDDFDEPLEEFKDSM